MSTKPTADWESRSSSTGRKTRSSFRKSTDWIYTTDSSPSDTHYATLVVRIIREALEKMSTSAGDSESCWSSVYNEKEETLSQLHCTREAPSAAPQMCEEALSPPLSTQHIRRLRRKANFFSSWSAKDMNEPELPLLNTQSSHEIVKELAVSYLLLLQRMRAENGKEWVERRKEGKWNDESLLQDTLIYTEKLHAAHCKLSCNYVCNCTIR